MRGGKVLIYISERILNIQDLEKEIKNTALHFEILKKELKKTAPSSDVVDAAVYQISQSLEKANDFEFCLEQRKSVYENEERVTVEERKYINDTDSQVTVLLNFPARNGENYPTYPNGKALKKFFLNFEDIERR